MNVKRLLTVLVIVVVIIATMVPITGYFILKNRDIRTWIADRAAEQTGWDIRYDQHRISLLKGLILTELTITGPDGLTIRTRRVRLHPAYLKLITGELFIAEAEIDEPVVQITPHPASRSTDTPRGETDQADTPPPPIGAITVSDGTLIIQTDPEPVRISGIQLEVREDGRFAGSLEIGSRDNSLEVTGRLEELTRLDELDGTLTLGDVDALETILDTRLPVEAINGEIHVAVTSDGDQLNLDTTIELDQLIPNTGRTPVNLPLKGDLVCSTSHKLDQFRLDSGDLQLGKTMIDISGVLVPELALAATLEAADIEEILAIVPPDLLPFPADMKLAGPVTGTVNLGKDTLNAALKATGLNATLPGLSPLSVDAAISADYQTLRMDPVALTGDWLTATVTGTVEHYLSPTPQTHLTLHVQDGRLPVPQPQTTTSTKASPRQHTATDITLTYPAYDGIAHDIKIRMDRFTFGEMQIGDLAATLKAHDAETRFQLGRVTLLNGTIQGNARLVPNENGLGISASGSAIGIQLVKSLVRKAPLDGGTANARFDFNGSAGTLAELKQVLEGSVQYEIQDAVLRDDPVVRKAQELLKTPLVGQKVKAFNGFAEIRNGWIDVREQILETAPLTIRLSGRASLTGTLDFRPVVIVSKEAAANLPGTLRNLSGDGTVTVPLKISGTVSDPTVKPDTSALVDKAKEKIKNKLLDKLFGGN